MIDKELLELAAKAVGYELLWGGTYKVGDDVVDCTDFPYTASNQPDVACAYWNPFEDDGDALRLAVRLSINIVPNYHAEWHTGSGDTFKTGREFTTECEVQADPYAATRRAIVRAAAEIGKTIAEKSA